MSLASQSKLFISFIIFIAIISAALSYNATRNTGIRIQNNNEMGKIAQGIFELNLLTTEFMSFRSRRAKEQWTLRHASVTNLLLHSMSNHRQINTNRLSRLRKNLAKMRKHFLSITFAASKNQFLNEQQNLKYVNSINTQMRLISQQIVADVNTLARQSLIKLQDAENEARILHSLSLVLVTLVSLGMLVWVHKQFLKPILSLKESASKLSKGQYDIKIPLKNKNEVTELSRSFNTLSDSISEKINQLTEQANNLEKSNLNLENAYRSIKSGELRYSTIFSSAMDGLITIDSGGTIQETNPAAESLFGYGSGELVGRNVKILVPSPHKEKHDSYIDNHNRTGINKIIGIGRDVEGLHKNGDLIPISLSISKMHIEDKIYYSAVTRDISLEIASREQLLASNFRLEAANKELESYAYSISHDLRSPLRTIDGFSMILQEDFGDEFSDEAKAYLNRIRKGTGKMGELIKNLLQMSRITQENLDFVRINLSEIAEDEIAKLKIEYPKLDIIFYCEKNLVTYADKALIQAVLENLLSNSVKYSSKNNVCEIYFYSRTTNGRTEYCIKDNGVGFDMKHSDKLFTPFQRLHKVKDFDGSGIGLATVQRIISRHNGTIRGESSIDEGASFYFTLDAHPTHNNYKTTDPSVTNLNSISDSAVTNEASKSSLPIREKENIIA